MNINDGIRKVMNDKLTKSSEFEFTGRLEDVTLSDIDYIDKLSNIKNKFNYQIVDNTYIKINCSR